MIKYASQELLLPCLELQQFVDDWLSTEDLRHFGVPLSRATNRNDSRSVARAKIGIGLPNYPDPPETRLNTLYWPTGALRWSWGLFLVDEQTKRKILKEDPTAKDLVMSDGTNTLTTKMHALSPRPISGTDAPDLWILPLVDERYFWQFKHSGAISVTEATTWAQLFTTLSSALNVTGDISLSEVTKKYGVPDPTEFSRTYENAAAILDAACHSIGRRLVRWLDGTVKAISWEESSQTISENLKTYLGTAGGDFTSDTKRGRPESILVTFPKYVNEVPDANGELYTREVDTADPGGVSNAIRVIHDTAIADFEDGSEPKKKSGLQQLAQQIADDDELSSSRQYDRSFAGLKNWKSVGWDDHTIFVAGDYRNSGTACSTRVQSAPYNLAVDEMLHQIGPGCFKLTECVEEDPDIIYATSAIDGDGEEVDLYEYVDGTVRLDDEVCYQVEIADEDNEEDAEQCESEGTEVTVLENYDDCDGCKCIELTDCDTGMTTIITYTDILGMGFVEGDFVRLDGESSVCWEITDDDVACGESSVEVTVEEGFETPFEDCETCEANPKYTLSNDCLREDCDEGQAKDDIVTTMGLADLVGQYVRIDGLCYSVAEAEGDPDETDESVSYSGPYDTCNDCLSAPMTVKKTVVVDINATDGIVKEEWIFENGILVGICPLDDTAVGDCDS